MSGIRTLSVEHLARELIEPGDRSTITIRHEISPHLRTASWRLPDPCSWLGGLAASASLDLYSSGTGGISKRIRRRVSGFIDEASLLIRTAELDSVSEVFCQAPVNHAFGLQCGLVLAAVLQVPFTFLAMLEFDARFARRDALQVALPATWRWLSRNPEFCVAPARLRILHSAGPIPPRRECLPTDLQSAHDQAFEVFGTTETGAIAYRIGRDRQTPWGLFEDVELAPSLGGQEETLLRLRSPRCMDSKDLADTADARRLQSGYIETGDLVRLVGPRSFVHIGRVRSVIKVNGINLDLECLEIRARMALPDVEFQLHPLVDPLRGQSFEIRLKKAPETHTARTEGEVLHAVSKLCPAGIYPLGVSYRSELSWTQSNKTVRPRSCDKV